MSSKRLNCSIRPAVHVTFNNSSTNEDSFKSGCAYMDVYFTRTPDVTIHDIRIKNYYTYRVMVLQPRMEALKASDGETRWKVCVPWTTLMPSAHLEHGSEDCFSLKDQFIDPTIEKATMLRMYMQQPSPVWREFRVEDVQCYGEISTPRSPLSSSISNSSVNPLSPSALVANQLTDLPLPSSLPSPPLPSWFSMKKEAHKTDSSNKLASTLSDDLINLFSNFATFQKHTPADIDGMFNIKSK